MQTTPRWGCFTEGTDVLTVSGYKKIEEIQIGDLVWAYDDESGSKKLKKVIHTFTREFSQIYKIHISDEIIEVTHEHPFFIGGKWLKVDELKEGDLVTLYDGTTQRIDKIEFIDSGLFKVYNFTVEDYHTYFVSENNILVHNGNPCTFENLSPSTLKNELEIAKEFGVGALEIGSKKFDDIISDGPMKFVVMPDGELKMMQKFKDGQEFSHTVMTEGEKVLSAGEAMIAGNRETGYFILEFTNHSGHYKPSSESLMIAEEALKEYLNILGGL